MIARVKTQKIRLNISIVWSSLPEYIHIRWYLGCGRNSQVLQFNESYWTILSGVLWIKLHKVGVSFVSLSESAAFWLKFLHQYFPVLLIDFQYCIVQKRIWDICPDWDLPACKSEFMHYLKFDRLTKAQGNLS